MLSPITLAELESRSIRAAHDQLRLLKSRIREHPRDIPAALRAPYDVRTFAALGESARFLHVRTQLRLQTFDALVRLYPIVT